MSTAKPKHVKESDWEAAISQPASGAHHREHHREADELRARLELIASQRDAAEAVVEAADVYVIEMGFDHRPLDKRQRTIRLSLVRAIRSWRRTTKAPPKRSTGR